MKNQKPNDQLSQLARILRQPRYAALAFGAASLVVVGAGVVLRNFSNGDTPLNTGGFSEGPTSALERPAETQLSSGLDSTDMATFGEKPTQGARGSGGNTPVAPDSQDKAEKTETPLSEFPTGADPRKLNLKGQEQGGGGSSGAAAAAPSLGGPFERMSSLAGRAFNNSQAFFRSLGGKTRQAGAPKNQGGAAPQTQSSADKTAVNTGPKTSVGAGGRTNVVGNSAGSPITMGGKPIGGTGAGLGEGPKESKGSGGQGGGGSGGGGGGGTTTSTTTASGTVVTSSGTMVLALEALNNAFDSLNEECGAWKTPVSETCLKLQAETIAADKEVDGLFGQASSGVKLLIGEIEKSCGSGFWMGGAKNPGESAKNCNNAIEAALEAAKKEELEKSLEKNPEVVDADAGDLRQALENLNKAFDALSKECGQWKTPISEQCLKLQAETIAADNKVDGLFGQASSNVKLLIGEIEKSCGSGFWMGGAKNPGESAKNCNNAIEAALAEAKKAEEDEKETAGDDKGDGGTEEEKAASIEETEKTNSADVKESEDGDAAGISGSTKTITNEDLKKLSHDMEDAEKDVAETKKNKDEKCGVGRQYRPNAEECKNAKNEFDEAVKQKRLMEESANKTVSTAQTEYEEALRNKTKNCPASQNRGSRSKSGECVQAEKEVAEAKGRLDDAWNARGCIGAWETPQQCWNEFLGTKKEIGGETSEETPIQAVRAAEKDLEAAQRAKNAACAAAGGRGNQKVSNPEACQKAKEEVAAAQKKVEDVKKEKYGCKNIIETFVECSRITIDGAAAIVLGTADKKIKTEDLNKETAGKDEKSEDVGNNEYKTDTIEGALGRLDASFRKLNTGCGNWEQTASEKCEKLRKEVVAAKKQVDTLFDNASDDVKAKIKAVRDSCGTGFWMGGAKNPAVSATNCLGTITAAASAAKQQKKDQERGVVDDAQKETTAKDQAASKNDTTTAMGLLNLTESEMKNWTSRQSYDLAKKLSDDLKDTKKWASGRMSPASSGYSKEMKLKYDEQERLAQALKTRSSENPADVLKSLGLKSDFSSLKLGDVKNVDYSSAKLGQQHVKTDQNQQKITTTTQPKTVVQDTQKTVSGQKDKLMVVDWNGTSKGMMVIECDPSKDMLRSGVNGKVCQLVRTAKELPVATWVGTNKNPSGWSFSQHCGKNETLKITNVPLPGRGKCEPKAVTSTLTNKNTTQPKTIQNNNTTATKTAGASNTGGGTRYFYSDPNDARIKGKKCSPGTKDGKGGLWCHW
jgi:hypothetical protein